MTLAERDALLSRLCGQVWPFAPLLDAVEVQPQARVLDIGGGEGGLLAELAGRGHLGQRELVNPLHGTDAHALPFPDAGFDVVFLLRVLGHLEHPVQALAEARRVLAPGGRLVVAAHGPDHLAGILESRGPERLCVELPGVQIQPVQISMPVVLSAADQGALASSYGRHIGPARAIRSQLQLAGFVLTEP